MGGKNRNMDIIKDYSKDSKFDELGLRRLKDSYMTPDEQSPQDRYAKIASKFASNPEHAQRLYEYFSNHWWSNSTPILSYGRSKKGLPISCFLSNNEDSAHGLTDTLTETAWLSMSGGGVGIAMNIRSADDKSVGVMPHMKIYDAHCLAYKQGSTRRGSYAIYLDIDHPDILQFIDMRKPTGDQNLRAMNLHHGVNLTDKFMQLIERCMNEPDVDDTWELKNPNSKEVIKTVSAKMLWQRLLETRLQTGEPYLHFIDTANNAMPSWLKDLGLKINGSNLCVAPETLLLTRDGYFPIHFLENQLVEVWNGKDFSETVVRKTGFNEKVVTVKTSAGMELTCTPEHKFYVVEGYNKARPIQKTTKELSVGDKLLKTSYPILNGEKELAYAYENGFYSGDGCEVSGKQRIYLYHEKRMLVDRVKGICENWHVQENQNREYGHTTLLEDKYFVPLDGYSVKSKVAWLSGYLDADGTVCTTLNDETQNLQMLSVDREFLSRIQLMLQTLGVYSMLTAGCEAGVRMMPKNDGSGELGEYDCQESFRLLIGNTGLLVLRELGLDCGRLVFNDHIPNRECSAYVKVTEVVDEGRTCDTYCVNEPVRNMAVFNGLLTGQCIEIELPTNKDRTAVCCLGSINLDYWDEYKDNYQFFRDVLEMLDNVLTVFIADAPPELHRAVLSASRERSVGVGVLGFHSYLQSKNIPFDNPMAFGLNLSIFKTMQENFERANRELAVERGEAPDAVGTGYRLSHTMAVAPTATSSIIMGNTSPSIEPFKANAYRQDTLSGSYLNKNKHLVRIIDELYGEEADEVWKSIIAHDGSVQHLDKLDDWTKEVFKTAIEISQQAIVELAGQRAPFIDQGQSINLFLPPSADIKYLSDIHYLAWKRGLKGLYYLRSEKVKTFDKVSQKVERVVIDECVACGS